MKNFRKLSGVCILATSLIATEGFAAGKPKVGSTTASAINEPSPLNLVLLLDVGTKAFSLPNGTAVDLNADLKQILETAVTITPNFRTIADATTVSTDPCKSHLELKAAVTSVDLNVASVGVNFGYTPSGVVSGVTTATGKVKVDIGLIGMDFSVRSCAGGTCTSAIAITETHLTSVVSGSFEVDLGQIKTSADFVWKTSFNQILRKIMESAMSKVARSPYLDRLPWNAIITAITPQTGEITFDAGNESNLSNQQSFGVYQAIGSLGACPTYQNIAYAHTERVDVGSSAALIEQTFEGASVKVGDEIRIRPVSTQ